MYVSGKFNGEIIFNAIKTIYALQEKNAEQKAEIERLTEIHERIAWSKKEYLDWVHGFLSTHTDMKDRGEDYKMFDLDWMCGVFWAKIEGSIEYIIDLENPCNGDCPEMKEYRKTHKHRKGLRKGKEVGV